MNQIIALVIGVSAIAAPSTRELRQQALPLTTCLTPAEHKTARGAIGRDIRARMQLANQKNRQAWLKIKTRKQWESYKIERIGRLRRSLGEFPKIQNMRIEVTGRVSGDGFEIRNLIYESRPGQWVSGNLYAPKKPTKASPGILIAHSHHRPKRQGEMQDMGMTWARAGCYVLVIDQIGYGERRAHPFRRSTDYHKRFRVSRQDYFYRYDSGIQLQLAGDSLMGWMAWDLMRGVDVLMRQGASQKKIILLGSVAGGGDPCGVTAALDPRISAAVPFNFGGPQPESKYPLPEDSEQSFNYLGGSYWESTRGLRRGGIDDFPHWVIVASIAPRHLIHAHEFAWDRDHDPVWKRYQKIFGSFYDKLDRLAFAHGHGLLRGPSSKASHCTNIGKTHRRLIHKAFKQWFGIDVNSKTEYRSRVNTSKLVCMTKEARQRLKPKSLTELVSAVARGRLTSARQRLNSIASNKRREYLTRQWTRLLGSTDPARVTVTTRKSKSLNNVIVKQFVATAGTHRLPLLLLLPKNSAPRHRVVVAVAQAGKQGFIQHRTKTIVDLLDAGVAVCLPDLRGTGEVAAGSSRGRRSGDGNRSVNMLLFGKTLLGQRVKDLRGVVSFLRTRDDIDSKRIGLWGDSFAAVNEKGSKVVVPRGVDGRPKQPEPMGGLVANLTALFEPDVRCVVSQNGLSSFHSVLSTPYVLIPHDVVVPQVLKVSDINDVVKVLAPRPVLIQQSVDGQNRRVKSASQNVAAWLRANL